jgi:hypothetical protein
MLELRPACENCNKQLPPESTEAMICTFECTFCAGCVESVLHNVCPNCGGWLFSATDKTDEKLEGGEFLRKVPSRSKRKGPTC